MIGKEIKAREVINKIRFDENMFDKSIEHLKEEIQTIAKLYEYDENKVIDILKSRLTASNMSTEACVTAIGFIISAKAEENCEKDLDKATKQQILNSAMYFANCEGIDPTACLTLE